MKKLVYLLCFMLLGLKCHAVENFSLELAPTIPIDGKVKTHGNKDTIITNFESPHSEMLKSFVGDDVSFLSLTKTLATTTIAMLLAIGSGDPYIIQIDGTSYIMIKDNPSKQWSQDDIVGIDDTRETIFTGLKSLESDGDSSKLTQEELKRANIRFVKIDDNGAILVNDKKQDFSLDNISYIDMKNLRKLANSSVTGVFGHFNLYLKTSDNSKKMVVGYATIHEDNNDEILFK